MKVRIVSDIHLEFTPLVLPAITDESSSVLVLAGDIGVVEKPDRLVAFLKDVCLRHQKVIYVFGNHELWSGALARAPMKLRQAAPFYNLHILENESIVIDDVAFIGATLWTNYHNDNPVAKWEAQNGMTDFKQIRCGPASDPFRNKFTANHAWGINRQSKQYIFKEIEKQKGANKKTIVVTHHAPSFNSVSPYYRTERDHLFNGAFASEYGNDIADNGPDIWIHGHIHYKNDYMINNTRVICNPRGYIPDEPVKNFDASMAITI